MTDDPLSPEVRARLVQRLRDCAEEGEMDADAMSQAAALIEQQERERADVERHWAEQAAEDAQELADFGVAQQSNLSEIDRLNDLVLAFMVAELGGYVINGEEKPNV